MSYPIPTDTHSPVFFFSSRRRHTRCLSDWSSDVCSSDLFAAPLGVATARCILVQPQGAEATRLGASALTRHGSPHPRSEERRVGKECRYRRRTYASKKQTTNGLTCYYRTPEENSRCTRNA